MKEYDGAALKFNETNISSVLLFYLLLLSFATELI